ncbi:hypothetical protein NLJ89_g10532 [Agrocybe chaxingu]|uniref:Cytochrome P450 n=1 Tax=Agrocybe chaxingu TaxID=84603 RepID=A0A9W8JQF0_9AGAR|nr:hypothetical protein NLJ89_g10532 [Agrocybe chaxingu]
MDSVILQAIGIATLATCLWVFRRRLRVTALDNLPGPPAKSWLFGSWEQLFGRGAWDYHRQISETYGDIMRVKGLCGANNLYVYDPKAVHHILVKDQDLYEETAGFLKTNSFTFGDSFFTALGDRHRLHRKMLNPVFSIAHMREMVPLFYEISHKLENTLRKMTANGPKEVDMLEWNTRLALELIGQSGLGYTFDTLEEGSTPHPYGIASKQFMPLSGGFHANVAKEVIAPIVARFAGPRVGRFLANWVPWKDLQGFRDVIDTLNGTAAEILAEKKKVILVGDEAMKAQVGHGKDIISILLKSNMDALGEDKLTDEELHGQVSALTFAATDTTSSALSRILYLLAINKDCQDRLRQEIRQAKEDNGGRDIDYDTLVSLPYLDAICRETLRLYSPVPYLLRTARADMVLPLATPVKGIDGSDIQEVLVPNGTILFVSVVSSNTNTKLWGPDSYEWKPERWLNKLPDTVINARLPGVYSHLLTFFAGGRSCIGFKFSQLEMKVALALLVDQLEFAVSKEQIVWQMTAVVLPHPDYDSVRPRLPLMISRAA